MFIRLTNTAPVSRSTGRCRDLHGRRRKMPRNSWLTRPGVEKFENPARAFGANPRHLAEVGDGSALDLLQRSEMVQQRPLARRSDAGNFLQSGLADILLAQLAVRADHKTMGLVA